MIDTNPQGLSARIWIAANNSAGLTMKEISKAVDASHKTVNSAVCQMVLVNTLAKECIDGVMYYYVADTCKIALGVLLKDIAGSRD